MIPPNIAFLTAILVPAKYYKIIYLPLIAKNPPVNVPAIIGLMKSY